MNAWTGQQLLTWGGFVFTGLGDEVPEADGFRFDAQDRSWDEIAAAPLAPRAYAASAWTGDELLVWGGSDRRQERLFGDGAAYDPRTDSWRLLPRAPIAPRAPLSVWTGRELVVWGTALRVEPRPRDGAAYDPHADRWRRIAESPIELTDATAVWTGREMIVFGGALHGGNFPETKHAIGAAYDPATDSWRRLPGSELSPQASTAAWNGQELIAWDYLHGSATYDPEGDRWRSLPNVPLLAGECHPETIAADRRVFGHYCGLTAVYQPETARWHDISRAEHLNWGFDLVSADPVVLLVGRNAESDDERLLAYRPAD